MVSHIAALLLSMYTDAWTSCSNLFVCGQIIAGWSHLDTILICLLFKDVLKIKLISWLWVYFKEK
jgi:hypothetical protein